MSNSNNPTPQGNSMNDVSSIMQSANEAIYQLQFNTREAISYVMRNADANREEAKAALQKVMLYYKED